MKPVILATDMIHELSQRLPGLIFKLHRHADGRFFLPFASQALCDLFQIDPEMGFVDVVSTLKRWMPEDFEACWHGLLASARDMTPWRQNYRVRVAGHQDQWHMVHAQPYAQPDGSVIWYGLVSDITDHIDTQQKLQTVHAQFVLRTNLMEVTLDSLSQGVLMMSPHGQVTYYNQQFLRLLNLPESLLMRQPHISELVDWQRAQGQFDDELDTPGLCEFGDYRQIQQFSFPSVYLRHCIDGRALEVKTHYLADGSWVRTFADVSDYIQAQRTLAQSELQLRSVFNAIPDRVWLKNTQGQFMMCNPEAEAAFGMTFDQIKGKTEVEMSPPHGLMHQHQATDEQALACTQPVVFEQELPHAAAEQGRAMFEITKTVVLSPDGQACGVLGMARDISSRKNAEMQIEKLAFYDPLTGLCNRRLFQDRLEQAQLSSGRRGQWAAICFIDLDNFKDLNDTQGHDFGDLLLIQVGQRLQAAVRDQDTVARLGGDEFVVLLEALGDDVQQASVDAHSVGSKLLEALTQPYDLGRGPHHNTPSIGITLFQGNDEPVADILKRADLAMYQAKSAGRNTVRIFDPQMQVVVQRRSALERDLRDALACQQLQLHYQPVVSANGVILGYEALARWQHPVRGMVSPAEFIPVAEQTGLILPIGTWVLHMACARLQQWALSPVRDQWTLAVNLSARQLRQPDFVATVSQCLHRFGVQPNRLKLELTESLLLHDVEDTIAKMDALAKMGIEFSLDDFGTGYSCLSYLKRLPLSVLKIDQSFVRDVLTDPNDAAIARTIFQLAQSLGLQVVAEGVETQGQKERLQSMGCLAFQGYLFGRPAPFAD